MSNFPRPGKGPDRWAELSEIIPAPHVEFLGEQIGPAEDRIKATLRWVFQQTRPEVIRRIYLARVSYGEPGVSSVALCVRFVENIEGTLQKGFQHMFEEISRRADSYDWLIIGEKQERELRKVCKPFHEAAQQTD